MSNYPKKRNLDGVYFRIRRDDKWYDLCFSDQIKVSNATTTIEF